MPRKNKSRTKSQNEDAQLPSTSFLLICKVTIGDICESALVSSGKDRSFIRLELFKKIIPHAIAIQNPKQKFHSLIGETEICNHAGLFAMRVNDQTVCHWLFALEYLSYPIILGVDYWVGAEVIYNWATKTCSVHGNKHVPLTEVVPTAESIGAYLSDKTWPVSSENESCSASCASDTPKKINKTSFDYSKDFKKITAEKLCALVSERIASQQTKGLTKLTQHKVLIRPDAKPFQQNLSRFDELDIEVMHNEIDRLIDGGYIERCTSEWSSRPYLEKKDGSWQLCINYKELNSRTYKSSYQLPDVLRILTKQLGRPNYISSLFINDIYHHIEVEPESRKYTAFYVKGRGQYQWIRMPFGLTGGPPTCARLADITLELVHKRFHSLKLNIPAEEHIFVYQDNWIVVSKTLEEHAILLNVLLDVLYENEFQLNLDKCTICRERVECLGFVVDKNGVHVKKEAIDSIINYPTPTNKKQLRRFVGLVSWYQRYLQNIARVLGPLHKLCSPQTPWVWTSEADQAFRETKERLKNVPSLYPADPKFPFGVYVDVSLSGLGAILVQWDPAETKELLITCISRLFDEAECNYNTSKRERLGISWALKKLRHFLEGYHFTVYVVNTDHSVLPRVVNVEDLTEDWLVASDF